MNGLLALSLSNSVTEVGAIAAFAALLGIAILSLLVFSQAREIKRLREWAGRAPERAAEMEQRVSADAAARLRGEAPPAPAGVRVVPRKTPLVSAPVSTAVNATVAAVVPAAGSPGPSQVPGGAVGEVPVPGVQPGVVTAQPEEPAKETVVDGAQPEEPAKETVVDGPAPVTAAARAANASGRAPLPPSPSAPAPPAGVPAPVAPTSGAAAAALAGAGAVAAGPASRPPAPAAARSMPSRTVGAPTSSSPPRAPTPSRARPATSAATSAGALAGERAGAPISGSGPKYFKPERSPRRATALIVGGVIVGVLALVLAISVFKGGGGSTPTTRSSPSVSEAPATSSHKTASAVASNPSETAVVVLNGTGTPNLAHHLAADLQQGGYTLAAASTGVPPGTHTTTVVQYTHGHRADAKAVAKALNVTQVQPIEPAIALLAGSATVVVLAGADQASQLGGSGAQSNGEPAAGAGGEGTAGGQ